MFDYSFWDSLDEFTHNQAAYLWCELEPIDTVSGHPSKVLTISNLLFEATESGKLQSRETHPGIPFLGDTKIKRKHLEEWAKSRGQKPKFLFPEEREKAAMEIPRAEAPISIAKEETYLRTIAALALLLAEKEKRFQRNGKPNASQICQATEGLLDALIEAGAFSGKDGLSAESVRKHVAAGLELLNAAK